jgi:hypothetical protein
MNEESKASTSTEAAATTPPDSTPAEASPPATTAPPEATGSTPIAAQPAATQAPVDAAPAESAQPAKSDAPPAAAASNEPTPAAEPAPATLRTARFEFLQAAIQHGVQGHAVAASTPAAGRVAALSEHADIAKRELGALGSADWVTLMLQLLDKIRSVPVPTQEQITGWINLAGEVFSLWRQFFSHAKPVDQELNDALHNLGNSIEGNKILGALAQRADATGKAGNLDLTTFERILDGHQDKELAAIGVKPLTILPLVNAISHSKAMLAAKAEHEKVCATASA